MKHGIVRREAVEAALLKMALVVDRQNAADLFYRPMANKPHASPPFQAARALVLEGTEQPSGYTEPLLHRHRLALKAGSAL
jgi:malate synthase